MQADHNDQTNPTAVNPAPTDANPTDKPRTDRNRGGRDNRDGKPRTDRNRDANANANKDGNDDAANADGEHKDKKERGPRKPRFTPPEDWKEQLEKNTTIDSKIPSLPSDTDRLQRPNYNKFKNDLSYCDEEIDKHFRKVDGLKDEQKKVRFDQRDKNSTLYDQLKKLNEERKGHSTVLADNKKLKQEYTDKINHIDDQLRAVEKKSFSGKTMRKKELLEMIKLKEEEFKNTKKTSAEEKKMNDEITKLRNMVKTMPEFEKLKDERTAFNDKIKEINKQSKEEFDKISKVSDIIGDIKVRLDETNLKIKQEKEEKATTAEAEKQKRTLTPAEQQLESIKQEHFDEIKKLKERKQKLRDGYEKEWTDFEKQQFDLDRIHFAQKIQKRLKREEREKRRKEEDEKQKVLDEDKAKGLLQFKYADEITLCETLVSLLEDMKPDRKTAKATFESKEVTSHNVNADALKQENLVYIKPRKFDEGAEVVNKKKKNQKKNQKKEAPVANAETEKIAIHFDTLHLFNDVKVVPPTTYGQLDSVIGQLNEKKKYYEELREKEIAEAAIVKESAQEGEDKAEGENADNADKAEKTDKVEGEEKEEVAVRKEVEDRRKTKKAAELRDEDFPEL